MKRLWILAVLLTAFLIPAISFAWYGPIAVEGSHGGTGNDTTAWLIGVDATDTDDADRDTSIVFTWPSAGKDDLFIGYNVYDADSTAVVNIVLQQRLCPNDSIYAWARVDSTTGITVEGGSIGGVWDPGLLTPPAEFRLIVEADSLNDVGTVVELWLFRQEKGVN